MRILSLTATAACASAFTAPMSSSTNTGAPTRRAPRASIALESTRKDPRTGKIYVGEPEPLEELADLVGGLLGGLGRVADGLLGPAPVPIPIPVEDEREQARQRDRPAVKPCLIVTVLVFFAKYHAGNRATAATGSCIEGQPKLRP